MRHLTAALAVMMAGPAWADPTVPTPAAARSASELRLTLLPGRGEPAGRTADPRARLRSAYGAPMVELFPLAGGDFRLSGGPGLLGRAGRPRHAQPDNLQLLSGVRGGPRLPRRVSPALLVGYGRPVDEALTLGVDAGLVMGRVQPAPDRLARPERQRLDAASEPRANPLARMTARYRF